MVLNETLGRRSTSLSILSVPANFDHLGKEKTHPQRFWSRPHYRRHSLILCLNLYQRIISKRFTSYRHEKLSLTQLRRKSRQKNLEAVLVWLDRYSSTLKERCQFALQGWFEQNYQTPLDGFHWKWRYFGRSIQNQVTQNGPWIRRNVVQKVPWNCSQPLWIRKVCEHQPIWNSSTNPTSKL